MLGKVMKRVMSEMKYIPGCGPHSRRHVHRHSGSLVLLPLRCHLRPRPLFRVRHRYYHQLSRLRHHRCRNLA